MVFDEIYKLINTLFLKKIGFECTSLYTKLYLESSYKNSIAVNTLLILPICINAQNIKIEGQVVENKEKESNPLENVSIMLLKSDYSFVQRGSTNDKGFFRLSSIYPGDYLLKASFLGYAPTFIRISNVQKNIQLGNIELKASSIRLNEVIVKGNNIVQKVDRMVLYPTAEALKHSYSSYDLINNMTIPRLRVNSMHKILETDDGSVQVRINGMKVSNEDFAAIRAKDIIRIEVVDNPGIRWGDSGLGAVVNLIVKRRDNGGLVNIQTDNSFYKPEGNNEFSIKLNRDKSQWGLDYSNWYNYWKERRTDAFETYYFKNDTINRIQQGMNDKMTSFRHWINLSYNLFSADNYMFNVVFRNYIYSNPYNHQFNKLFEKESPYFIYAKSRNRNTSYAPTLDLYFQKTLPHNQYMEFNVVGSLMNTTGKHSYQEYDTKNVDLADILTNVNGNQSSLYGEAIYDKTFKGTKISAGIRHNQVYSKNKYSGTNPVTSKMNQMTTSGFFELQGRMKTFSYLGSLGMTRSYFKEDRNKHTYYTFTPSVRLNFVPQKYSTLTYQFAIDPTIPSLSSLTNIEQAIDTIQIAKGNPDLKTFKSYRNSFMYMYIKNSLMSAVYAKYNYQDKPIMESFYTQGNKLIRTEENQRFMQTLNLGISLMYKNISIGSLKNFLTIVMEVNSPRYWSKGINYMHTHNSLGLHSGFMLNYKEFSLTGDYNKNSNSLYGETIQKVADEVGITLRYTHKGLQLESSIRQPFTKQYRYGSERLDNIAPHTTWNYFNEMKNLISIGIKYNFEFGKKFADHERKLKEINNDAGILNTNK